MDQLDKDHSGTIEFQEYVAYMIDLGVLDSASGVRPVHG